MAVLYKPYQSSIEDKKSGKKLYHSRVVYTSSTDINRLAQEIAAYSSLSPGNVKNTLIHHSVHRGHGDFVFPSEKNNLCVLCVLCGEHRD